MGIVGDEILPSHPFPINSGLSIQAGESFMSWCGGGVIACVEFEVNCLKCVEQKV